MNSAVLVGRVTKDIEVRKTQSGKSVVQFTLAVNRRGKDAGADFINCVAWEKAADVLAQYCHKGDRIGVIGRIATRSYDDKYSNKKVFVTEIMVDQFEFLEHKREMASDVPSVQNESDYDNAWENVKSAIDSPDLPF